MAFEILPKGLFGKFSFRFSRWDNQVNTNWLSLAAHYKGLVVSEVLNVVGDLPLTPANGESYILDSDFSVWTWFDTQWFTEPLAEFEIFYDLDNSAFYYFDGANIQPLIVNADIIPATTRMLFYEATAPLGWTLDVTVNDRFVRVSDTAGGTVSGTWNNLSHTHVYQHQHTNTHNHGAGSTPSGLRARLFPQGTGTNGIRYQFQAYSGGWTANYQTNGGTNSSAGSFSASGGVVVDGTTANYTGNTGNVSGSTSTNTPTGLTHGSTQHAYADFIICSRN